MKSTEEIRISQHVHGSMGELAGMERISITREPQEKLLENLSKNGIKIDSQRSTKTLSWGYDKVEHISTVVPLEVNFPSYTSPRVAEYILKDQSERISLKLVDYNNTHGSGRGTFGEITSGDRGIICSVELTDSENPKKQFDAIRIALNETFDFQYDTVKKVVERMKPFKL